MIPVFVNIISFLLYFLLALGVVYWADFSIKGPNYFRTPLRDLVLVVSILLLDLIYHVAKA